MKKHSELKCMVKCFSASEVEKVLSIERESFPEYPYDEKILISLSILEPELFLVAYCNGELSGYICGFLSRSGCAHVASIAVKKALRHKGLGSVLLNEFERRSKQLGAHCVELEVSVLNTDAIKFYKSRGYAIEKRIPRYYPDGADAFFMKKKLA